MVNRELYRPGWKTLVSLGLELIELGPDLVAELFELNQIHRSISFIDLTTLVVAKDLRGILLTGDQHLRNLAIEYELLVHGILWALDKLVEFDVLSGITARVALEQMLFKGSYLPQEGVTKRCICGTLIHFTGYDGRKIQRSMDKLERDRKRLSRRIKF